MEKFLLSTEEKMKDILNPHDRDILAASIFHAKTHLNMGLVPDLTSLRFIVDMAQKMSETVVHDPRKVQHPTKEKERSL